MSERPSDSAPPLEALGGRFADLPPYPFARLRGLLAQIPPGGPELVMTIGEPRHAPPGFALEALSRAAAGFGRYPPTEGPLGYRQAAADWLTRRFALPPGFVDPQKHVLALSGTREGLFMAAVALVPARKNGKIPAVLLPNPFYQCYAAAAVAAGAEPIFVPATAETGHLPDYASLPAEIWARTAFVYLCTPANPQGAAASRAYLADLLARTAKAGAVLASDECYSEIYDREPPTGALEVAAAGGGMENLLVFHSLSKRSNLPGLRMGFVAGGEKLVAEMARLRAYGGATVPTPLAAAGEAAWRDEAHVVENRRLYREKFDLADQILANLPGYARPEGGFFLWLKVGAGEETAVRLWRHHGLRVLPGAYLARDSDGTLGGPKGNPGAAYIRVALVEDLDATRQGLEILRRELTAPARRTEA